MATRKTLRKSLACGTVAVAMMVIALVFLVPDVRVTVLRKLLPGVCMTDELMTIPNLSGMKFEVTYTNCDALAKEDWVDVYVSKAPGVGESWFTGLFNRKALVYSYVPGHSALPSIKASGKSRILISNQDVSSVHFQKRKWREVSIDYDIGGVIYPMETNRR